MLKIERFVCNMLQENCYVASDDTGECVIVDCGAYAPEEREAVVGYINDNQLRPVHLLATHGHVDHNFGNNTIFDEFGLRPEVDEADADLMSRLPEQAAEIANVKVDYELPTVSHYLKQDDIIRFGHHAFTVIETPGHSPGSVFFYCEEEHVAFSGDTLFRGAIGRTDYIGGSMFQIIQSLRAVSQLPDETVILPGHGSQTTMGRELATNPYLDR